MSFTLKEVEREFINSCADITWRERQEGMERLLTNLVWWLEAKDAHSEALTISGLRNEFQFNTESAAAINHLLAETDCVSISDLLKRWAELEKLEDSLED